MYTNETHLIIISEIKQSLMFHSVWLRYPQASIYSHLLQCVNLKTLYALKCAELITMLKYENMCVGMVRVWYVFVVGIVFVGCGVCVCVFVCVWSACVFYVGVCGVGA